MLCRGLDLKLLELSHLVFDVLLVSAADELQVRHGAVAGRQDDQLSPILLTFLFPIVIVIVQVERH